MTERRARNIISRCKNTALCLRAADLLDEGATDDQVATALNAEFAEFIAEKYGRAISARTVMSFRNADYAGIAQERADRLEARNQTMMVLDAARGCGSVMAEATQDLMATQMYEMFREMKASGDIMDPKSLAQVGKVVTRILELQADKEKRADARDKANADRLKQLAAAGKPIDPNELVSTVDELMGLKQR